MRHDRVEEIDLARVYVPEASLDFLLQVMRFSSEVMSSEVYGIGQAERESDRTRKRERERRERRARERVSLS